MAIYKKEHFGIARKIVSNMTSESWEQIPHMSASYEADVTDFLKECKKLNAGADKNEKITINTVMMKVICEGLKAAPKMNTTLDFNRSLVRGTLNYHDQEVKTKLTACEKQAEKMTALRRKAAKTVEEQMSSRLIPLGIPNVRFKVDLSPKPLSMDGADKVQFLFSANTSTAMEPVAQVASGGEIARVMLSLKAMVSGAVKLPTIIFDEIDTGVSGKIAQKMALIMQEMGDNNRQVISITHLPQIAALGSSHYKVEKEETTEGTRSHMRELTQEQRVNEIAQMLSGADVSDAALQNARELLDLSKKK